MKNNHKIPILLFILAALSWLTSSLHAFKVQPVRLDLKINRGEQREVQLLLTGSQGTPTEPLIIYITDLRIQQNGVMVFDRRENLQFSAVNWIEAEEPSLTLQAGKARPLKFKVRIPRDAVPGEYYAIIMFEPKERTHIRAPDKPFQMRVMTRIAVPLIIDVPGRLYRKRGEVLAASAEQMADGRIQVKATFRNAGNIHENAVGTALIKSEDEKQTFCELPIKAANASRESGEGFVLPGDLRDFGGVTASPLPLPPGKYWVDVSVDYGDEFARARQKAAFEITQQFAIDLSNTSLLRAEPDQIEIDSPPGAFRSALLKVINTGIEPLTVKTDCDTPWIRAVPSFIVLRPGATANLRITSVLPKESMDPQKGIVRLTPNLGLSLAVPIIVTPQEKQGQSERKGRYS